MTKRDLLTPKETAEFLRISPRKLWALTHEANTPIPHIKMGRAVRYLRVEVERWLQSQLVGGDSNTK